MNQQQPIPPAHPPHDDALLEQLLHQRQYTKAGHEAPLQRLKRNMAIGQVYGVVITLGYAALIFYFPIWQVQAGLLICIAFNLWLMYTGQQLYNSIDPNLAQADVLSTLKQHHSRFTQWFRQQQRAALAVYPFAAAAGFLLGGTLGSGKPVEVMMQSRIMMVSLVVTTAVLVPACYALARWMLRKAYGQYVEQLQERITELEATD